MSVSIEHPPHDAVGMTCRLADSARGWTYTIRPGQRVLRRRPDLGFASSFAQDDPAVTAFVLDQYRAALNALFSFEAEWMNPVSADRRLDQNKLLGSTLASRVGLLTIPTILTDDPTTWAAAVRRFGEYGDIAVKPAGMWAARLDDTDSVVSLFTKRLSVAEAIDLADLVRHAPVIVQPYVEKAYELRITVVAGRVFACRIDSQLSTRTMTDWRRYDFEHTPHAPIQLEPKLEDALRDFMRVCAVQYAAIDMIVRPDGAHLFVEANPAGQFGWIEELTGLRISDAIADWLVADLDSTR
ncbi:MAG TPA: hypothetical protein VHB69_02780 [Mycobacteriales bacterium]|nr:hypothetical protein [Mycobacteriales bacterium]